MKVVEIGEHRNEVSCLVRYQLQVLDTELRRLCGTSEEMLDDVDFSSVKFRAGT